MICGKGGCGKSTIAVLLARAFGARGYRVLLVDADESNIGIGRLLGSPAPTSLLNYLGGKKALQGRMRGAFTKGLPLELFSTRWGIEDIPRDCLVENGGIRLLLIGKIEDFGEGCACPMGVLSKSFLSNLTAMEKDVVLVDSEAGVEHFGRSVESGCDIIVGIVDPTYESVLLSKKMQEMAKEAGRRIFFILNKVNGQVEETLIGHMDGEMIVAKIPQRQDIFAATFKGNALTMELPGIEGLCDFLIEH